MTPLAYLVVAAVALFSALLGFWVGAGTLPRRGATPRCFVIPLDYVRCARAAGHHGDHMIRAQDVVNQGYGRRPF